MSARVAESAMRVPHSRVRELAEIAMSMDSAACSRDDRVLRLYFGESNLPRPDFIKRAAVEALADGYTFYTENAGLVSLRQAIARHYQRLHGIALEARSEIVATASGVQALCVGIRATLDPGDEALILTPAWPNARCSVERSNAVRRHG